MEAIGDGSNGDGTEGFYSRVSGAEKKMNESARLKSQPVHKQSRADPLRFGSHQNRVSIMKKQHRSSLNPRPKPCTSEVGSGAELYASVLIRTELVAWHVFSGMAGGGRSETDTYASV
ncbi:hypothetical protein LR48_Vigan11g058900 [Vigna angularis]|uniref:Uncharacterized protein n=1 Tax=Phaseolus angularis TaxID=3914 RepID=A0A0L9VR64_PHAAN|nr:hypothetical protein LR48_Vigan11g058900 [Vigna angularis]